MARVLAAILFPAPAHSLSRATAPTTRTTSLSHSPLPRTRTATFIVPLALEKTPFVPLPRAIALEPYPVPRRASALDVDAADVSILATIDAGAADVHARRPHSTHASPSRVLPSARAREREIHSQFNFPNQFVRSRAGSCPCRSPHTWGFRAWSMERVSRDRSFVQGGMTMTTLSAVR